MEGTDLDFDKDFDSGTDLDFDSGTDLDSGYSF